MTAPLEQERRDRTRMLTRLCLHLAARDCDARPDPFSLQRIILVSPRRGCAQPDGNLPAEAARIAVDEDLAQWTGPAAHRRLVATAAGRAYALRQQRDGVAGEGVTAFRRQHGGLAASQLHEDGGSRAILRNDSESPLAWLRRRSDRDGASMIDAAAFEAGEKLRRDLTMAALVPGVTIDWSRLATGRSGGGGFDPAAGNDAVIAARQRANAALAAVGTEFSGLLVDICGFLKGLAVVEAERGCPRRSAKVVLALALARLARHYGFASEAIGPARSQGLRRWQASPEASHGDGAPT